MFVYIKFNILHFEIRKICFFFLLKLLIFVYFRCCSNCLQFFVVDFAEEFDELDGNQTRIKPEAIDVLCRLTKFTKRELQFMYRGFKQASFC